MRTIGYVGNLEDYPEDTEDITFDDAPPQVKPTIAVKAPKARAPKARKSAPKAPLNVLSPNKAINDYVAALKPKRTRKSKVAKTAIATAKSKSKHRVQTVDSNKLEAYLDNLVNVEGYTLISVTGSQSMMGMFAVVSVKVG
jgi:hypothetical protein